MEKRSLFKASIQYLSALQIWEISYSGPKSAPVRLDDCSGAPNHEMAILSLLCLETEWLLDFQGRAEITSLVRWSLRMVIFARRVLISGTALPLPLQLKE